MSIKSIGEYLFNQRMVSLIFFIWVLCVVSWVIWRVFSESPPEIPSTTATLAGTVIGLPAAAIGLWKWRNTTKDETSDDR